jgi:hypothetical protein
LSTSRDALIGRQGLEQDRGCVHLAAAPARTDLEQLRPRDTQEQDGGLAGPVSEVFDQIEERRLAPMDVVEDEDDRALTSELLEELPHGPERVLGRARLGPTEQAGDEPGRSLRLVRAGEDGLELGPGDSRRVGVEDRRGPVDHLGQREERDPVPVGEASATENRRA